MTSSSKSTLPLGETSPLNHNHSPGNIDGLVQHLGNIHNIDHTLSATDLVSKSRTRHSPASDNQLPKAIFYPTTTEDVSLILKACHERSIAVTSYSGGTSLGGALTATRAGICVDFSKMDRVIELHEQDMDVVVQPGVGWVELNKELESKGLFWPPDPAPGARVGGMVSFGLVFLRRSPTLQIACCNESP